MTNGHTAGGVAEAMVAVGEPAQNGQGEASDTTANVTNASRVPEEMRALLDEIAAQEGISERLKEEVWQDAHARNVRLLVCCIWAVLIADKFIRTVNSDPVRPWYRE